MNGQRSGLPCIKCASSDAMTVYPKGDAYCFSCETYFSEQQVEEGDVDQSVSKPEVSTSRTASGDPVDVQSRGLKRQTLSHFGVKCGFDPQDGDVLELHFPVYKDGVQHGTKVKNLRDGTYFAKGNGKNPDLFGQAQAGSGGKLLIITEGECDCMAVHQLLQSIQKNYKVVSLPNGANVRAVQDNLEWIERFDTVVINFDNDDPGKDAATKVAETLTPGKCKILSLPNNVKDANEFLLQGGTGDEYYRRLNNAKPYRPDGVVATSLTNILEYLKKSDEAGPSIPYPWNGLNRLIYGMREKELVTWTAGTGIGKSAVIREIEHHLLKVTRDTVGVLALEESVDRTMWGVLAVEANLPIAIKEQRIKRDLTWESPEVMDWIKHSGMEDRMQILDHWGSTSDSNLINKIRFMIRGLNCKHIVLDHLAIVVSGMDIHEDERKTIDRIMTQLRQLSEETGASMHIVSHLRRVDGNRGHEQGLEIGLSHLRGSQAIAQLSDAVIAMERNQQADDQREANLTRLRVLKNRYAGMTGLACNLAYDPETGRLREIYNVEEYLAPSPEETGGV